MRDRLIELVDYGSNDYASYSTEMALSGNYGMESMGEFIADKILADGWMRPPCKVGGFVYSIVDCINRPEKLFVTAMHQYEKYISFSALSRSQRKYVFEEKDIGKTVFLTREEAEAKLKEGGEG